MAGQFISLKTAINLDLNKFNRLTEKSKERMLKSAGAYVRSVARNSIKKTGPKGVPDFIAQRHSRAVSRARRRKEKIKARTPKKRLLPAPAGQPPRDRLGKLKKSIRFSFDHSSSSVFVGAEPNGSGTAYLLEHGGEKEMKTDRNTKTRMTFKGNPFMRPALEKSVNEDEFVNIFRKFL